MNRKPSVSSLFLTFTQATHLPMAMIWCLLRGLATHPSWENWFVGLTIHLGSFLVPSIEYRSQLTGGWFSPPAGARGAGTRAVPLLEQFRNVFLIGLYAEYMAVCSSWIYHQQIPQNMITRAADLIRPELANALMTSCLSFADSWTPRALVEQVPIVRLALFAGAGYFVLYGALATVLGEGLEKFKKFMRNWYESARALDVQRGIN